MRNGTVYAWHGTKMAMETGRKMSSVVEVTYIDYSYLCLWVVVVYSCGLWFDEAGIFGGVVLSVH